MRDDASSDAGEVVLRDGSTVSLRPIQPADEANLLALFQSFSTESKQFRFFTAAPDLARVAHEECTLASDAGFGMLATRGADGEIVGHASYRVSGPACAEVDFAVAGEYRGRGLATLLLARLAEVAAARGIDTFEAEVLPANQRMIEVFRASGFPVEITPAREVLEVRFPTQFSEQALERFERREQIAATSALQMFLCPRSVAVIGASRRRGTPGGEVFHNLLNAELAGPVYPVNFAADVVQSVRAYPSVEATPGPVDLAVIAVPCEHVVDTARQCARKKVRALVVLSAGFAEVGPEGRARQADLLRVCRAAGMRLMGPNCIGVANTDPAVRLNATFAPVAPREGRVGFMSQSGAPWAWLPWTTPQRGDWASRASCR